MLSIPDFEWFLQNIMNTIVFFVILFISTPTIVSRKNILISIFVSIIFSILDYRIDGISLIAVFIVTFLFLKKSGLSFAYKFLLFVFSFLTSTLTINVAVEIVFSFFPPTGTTEINTIIPILMVISLNLLLSILITVFFKFFKNKMKSISIDKTINNILLLSLIILIVGYLYLFMKVKYLNPSFIYLKWIIGISIILIFFTLIGASFLISSRIKKIKIEFDLKQLKERNIYIRELEAKNTELRRFKHDYKNILLSLSASNNKISDNTIKELLDAPNLNIDSSLDQNDDNLYHIKNELVRGILVIKLMNAKNENIDVRYEIDSDVTIPEDKSIIITRILGILFDNAIEASLGAVNPKLNFALINYDDYIEFVVNNNFADNHAIDVNSIFQAKYTTKKNHSGLGLSTVKRIIDSNSELLLQTKVENNIFSIILTLLKNDQYS